MNTTRNWILLTAFTILAFFATKWLAEYQDKKSTITEPTVELDLDAIKERGSLRVIMEYNSIGYFIYKGQRMGFEFELMQQFAQSIGVKLVLIIAENNENPFNLLNEGKGDIVANGLLYSQITKHQVALTAPYRNVEQVIVQRKKSISNNPADSLKRNDTILNTVQDLADKIIYVADNSVYYNHLKEISDSIGINMDVRILPDGRTTDDIIEAIANGEIDYTISNKDIAQVNQSYFDNLDIHAVIGKPENLHWAVRKNAPELLEQINEWLIQFEKGKLYSSIYFKYFNEDKHIHFGYNEEAELQQGMISHYDAIIQHHAQKINWDWRLVAAIIYQESKFNPNARSWCGAQGLMQLMPGTARQIGVPASQVYNPNSNIKGGTDYLKYLEKTWANVADFTQRIKFILASYNAGPGHVQDAARLAEKNGYPKDKWDGSVEYFMLYKSNPRFYRDPVVKYGYCRGQEPFNYVRNIIKKYFDYQSKVTTSNAQIAGNFKLEQIEPLAFDGIEGVYNPTEGLIARSAKRELFLSHRLFEEQNELTPKVQGRNPFDKPKKELFVRKEKGEIQDSGKQIFKNKQQLFQGQSKYGLEVNDENKINKLTPKR